MNTINEKAKEKANAIIEVLQDINPEAVIFRNEDYETALIGYTEDGRAVYEYDKMVQYLIDKNDMDELEAIEWIEYNTMRALPYFGEFAPIIVHTET